MACVFRAVSWMTLNFFLGFPSVETPADCAVAGVANGAKWVKLHGFVLDVSTWAKQHPGGDKLLLQEVGKDISTLFTSADEATGGYYKHSNAGKNLAATLRVTLALPLSVVSPLGVRLTPALREALA